MNSGKTNEFRPSKPADREKQMSSAVDARQSGKTNEFRPSSPVNREKQMSSGR